MYGGLHCAQPHLLPSISVSTMYVVCGSGQGLSAYGQKHWQANSLWLHSLSRQCAGLLHLPVRWPLPRNQLHARATLAHCDRGLSRSFDARCAASRSAAERRGGTLSRFCISYKPLARPIGWTPVVLPRSLGLRQDKITRGVKMDGGIVVHWRTDSLLDRDGGCVPRVC